MQSNTSPRIKTAIRWVVTLVLLAYVVRQINWHEVIAQTTTIPWIAIAIPTIAFPITLILAGLRWQIILRQTGIRRKLSLLIRALSVGSLSNFVLPSTLAGDVVRATIIDRQEKRGALAIATVIDRASSAVTMLTVILVGITLLEGIPVQIKIAGEITLGIVLFTFAILVAKPMWFTRLIHRCTPARIAKKIHTVFEALDLLSTSRKTIIETAIVATSISLISLFCNYALMKAIVPGMTIPALAVALPLARVASTLPITIGGIGALETVLLELLRKTGANASDIVTFSAIVYAITILGSVVHIIIATFMLRHEEPHHSEESKNNDNNRKEN